jgi:hypothetical protein
MKPKHAQLSVSRMVLCVLTPRTIRADKWTECFAFSSSGSARVGSRVRNSPSAGVRVGLVLALIRRRVLVIVLIVVGVELGLIEGRVTCRASLAGPVP